MSALDQSAFPAVPVFPQGAVMVLPMATRMRKFEREAVLGVLVTAAAEAGAWREVSVEEFTAIARRGVTPMHLDDVVSMVRQMELNGLLELREENGADVIAPTPALVAMLEGASLDYTYEADRMDVEPKGQPACGVCRAPIPALVDLDDGPLACVCGRDFGLTLTPESRRAFEAEPAVWAGVVEVWEGSPS